MAGHKIKKIGVVGFGHLGEFMVSQIQSQDDLELVFVWNRSKDAFMGKVEPRYILDQLGDFTQRDVDLIVEVAHPDITRKYGPEFLKHADYLIGSPTALADPNLEASLRDTATSHGLYVPTGAFWGGEDIRKMADRGTLQGLKITMTKHPDSFKLNGDLAVRNSQVTDTAVTLYDGPVRGLCPFAPNNVNTMAAAALTAHNLGFDGVQGSIVADPNLHKFHIVEVEVWGPGDRDSGFYCKTVRRNPAQVGNVTGTATYTSFLSSLCNAHGKGPGIHLC